MRKRESEVVEEEGGDDWLREVVVWTAALPSSNWRRWDSRHLLVFLVNLEYLSCCSRQVLDEEKENDLVRISVVCGEQCLPV